VTTRPDASLARLRRALLWLLALSLGGTLAELLLIGHWDGWQQWVPLALLASALLVVGALLLRPTRVVATLARVCCIALAIAGLAGTWLHYDGNATFERESLPGTGGWALVSASLTGATPVLAPGALVTIALLGLLAIHRASASTDASDTASPP
jgi:hypothetical protein